MPASDTDWNTETSTRSAAAEEPAAPRPAASASAKTVGPAMTLLLPMSPRALTLTSRGGGSSLDPAIRSELPTIAEVADHAQAGRQRAVDAGRAGHADGRSVPLLLVAGADAARAAEAGLRPGAAAAPGRGSGRVPRFRRQNRHSARALPAPAVVAVLWPQRGERPALRLSRLEIRRRRALRRHAERAARVEFPPQGAANRLPGARMGRLHLGLHGRRGPGAAGAARARMGDLAGEPPLERQMVLRGELRPGARGRARQLPHLVPAS